MLEPLKQFICDSCGMVIEKPEDGWFEWLTIRDRNSNKYLNKEFRICHHSNKCQKHSHSAHCSDIALIDVVGDKAATQLLRFIDIGPYHSPAYYGREISDIREYVEIMRRLLIPYYEEARQWWSEAMNDGYFGGANEIYIYLPENLKKMIEHYSKP